MSDAPAIVVVGAASRDLAPDDPRGWRLGGGVSYSALTLARLGLRVGAIVGADALAARAAELDLLRDAGVEVVVEPLKHGPVFVNHETPDGRVQDVIDAADPMRLDGVPADWRPAPGWLFAPVAGELPDAWASVPASEATVGVGWQGLLRRLTAGQPVERVAPRAAALLARADLVGVGRDDLDPDQDIDALTRLLRPGATLVVTGADRGGILLEIGADRRPLRRRTWPSIPAARVVDPTGAGDVFLAALFAVHVEPRLIGGRGSGWDLRLAAAAASLACEGPGLHGVAGRAAIARRMAEVRPRG